MLEASRIDSLLRPRSIALIGASRDPDSMSGTLLRNLVESFRGAIYPVNPRTDVIDSLKTYPSIADIPEAVDLALIAVPSRHVLDVVRQSLDSGARAIVVITAGFGEVGDAGSRRAAELQRLASDAGVPLIGPNCLGLLSTDPESPFNATFSAAKPQPGNVGVLTQSGALGFVFPECNRKWNIGLSKLVSLGNKLCLGENDLLAALEHDEQTSVVQLYLESFQNPRVFREVATRVSHRKPILALKAGRTDAGLRAAGSHTAALASSTAATDALFRQSGVVSANSLEELFDITALMATQPLPRGRRVAVLSNAGGPGVLCADAIEAAGLLLPEFSSSLQHKLREYLPAEATVRNPIDLIGSTNPEEFARCLELLLEHDESDSIIAIYVPRLAETSDAIAARIVNVLRQHPSSQAILSVFMQQEPAPDVLTSAEPPVPAWTYPESAVKALGSAIRLVDWRNRTSAPITGPPPEFDGERIRRVADRSLDWLTPDMTAELLNAAGVTVAEQAVAESVNAAVEAAQQIGFPVVAKAIAPGLVHRSDAGAVIVDVKDAASLHHVAGRLFDSVPGCEALLIQKFVECNREFVIGVSREPGFGHLIGFGLGGVDVEVIGDMQFRMHPLTTSDAEELIHEHPAARLLDAHRGRSPGDVPALIDTLLRISELLSVCPEIAEADLNPVKVLDDGHGVCIVDARIRFQQSKETGANGENRGAALRDFDPSVLSCSTAG